MMWYTLIAYAMLPDRRAMSYNDGKHAGYSSEIHSTSMSFVAYVTNNVAEFAGCNGDPGEDAVKKYNDSMVWMKDNTGNNCKIMFPYSLNTAKGQRLFKSSYDRLTVLTKLIPSQCAYVVDNIRSWITVRQVNNKSNLVMIMEALLHRAATEYKLEVLFAFDSLKVWINKTYGKIVGYKTIRRGLEKLQEMGFIVVNYWGQRGIRNRATQIRLTCLNPDNLASEEKTTYWMDTRAVAISSVYIREDKTRFEVRKNDERLKHKVDVILKQCAYGNKITILNNPDLTNQLCDEFSLSKTPSSSGKRRIKGDLRGRKRIFKPRKTKKPPELATI